MTNLDSSPLWVQASKFRQIGIEILEYWKTEVAQNPDASKSAYHALVPWISILNQTLSNDSTPLSRWGYKYDATCLDKILKFLKINVQASPAAPVTYWGMRSLVSGVLKTGDIDLQIALVSAGADEDDQERIYKELLRQADVKSPGAEIEDRDRIYDEIIRQGEEKAW